MPHPHTPEFLTSSTITLLICTLGLTGNTLCTITLFSKHIPRSSYIYLMQSLTISDICLLTLSSLRTLDNLSILTLPTDQAYSTLIFFWDWISTSSTKYFTVAVSLERFFVITYPLRAHSILTPKRSRNSALGVLVFCVCLSCFSYAYVNWIDANSYNIYVAVVLHFFPFLLVGLFNVLIFIGLRNTRKQTSQLRKSQNKQDDDYSITKMLFTVVLVFGISYSFEFVRRMMNYVWRDYMEAHDYYHYTINNLADIFYVFNSSVNFVIYCVMGRRFRDVFFKVFWGEGCCKRGVGDGGRSCEVGEGERSKDEDSGNSSMTDCSSVKT